MPSPMTASNPGLAAPARTDRPASLKKVVALVGLAILCFVVIAGYQLLKSVQSRSSLDGVERVYFPVLIEADASIAIMDKVGGDYVNAVMAAAPDKAAAAHALGLEAVRHLHDMASLYPAQAAEIERLRAQLASTNDEAARLDADYLAHRTVLRLWLPRMQALNARLAATRDALKAFRARCYAEFTRALGDTRGAVQSNLTLSFALGIMNLGFMGVLVYFIRDNLRMMAQVADQNAHLERRVAERTAELARKTGDIQAMLQNLPQGVLTVTAGRRIHPEYSAYLETLFATRDIAGRDVMDLVFGAADLGADTRSQVATAIDACLGEDAFNFDFNSHLLVTECTRVLADGRLQALELGWAPICDAGQVVEKLMLCIRDVSELKRLTGEAQAQRRELEIIGEILAVSQEKFQAFVESSTEFLVQNEALLRRAAVKDIDTVSALFRNMHTVKGNARTYGLSHLTDAVHEAEQAYAQARDTLDAPWEPDRLLAQLAGVRAVLDDYARINDSTLGRRGPGRRGGVERFLMVDKNQVAASRQLIDAADFTDLESLRGTLVQIGHTLDLIGSETVDEALAGVVDALPSLARELGKEAPRLTIDAHGVRVRTQVAGLLRNVFTHLMRNALDHGLEPAAAREAAGKAGRGAIHLEVRLARGRLRFALRDDGRGLAVARIRRQALQQGVLADPAAPDEVAAQAIFASGFSTADAVTAVSGRGVGMDAVRDFLEREGGGVELRFLDDRAGADFRAFETVVWLPAKFGVAPSPAADRDAAAADAVRGQSA